MSAHMVHTVEELRALGPGSEIRFESPPGKEAILARRSGDWFVITGERGWYTEERLEHLLPATVLIEAIDPDDEALVERVARAGFVADNPGRRSAASEWDNLTMIPPVYESYRTIARAALKAVTQ